jgi:hypothetical protein
MTWKIIALSCLMGAIAIPASFLPIKAALTLYYMKTAPHDGQSALSVFFGSLYLSLLLGLVTFGVVLSQGRKRP